MDINFDFAQNIRAIEKLKAGLISAAAEMYESLCDAERGDATFEALSAMISTSYQLSDKLGMNRAELEKRVQERIKAG